MPVWVNCTAFCERYDNISHAITNIESLEGYEQCNVTYITLDGEGELTIEIEI